MQIMIKSSEDNILNIFKPKIVFLDDVFIAEEESSVNAFLEDYGLEKEDVKNAGLKIMKNKITIPIGTEAEIIDCKQSELTLRVKDIEFDCVLSFRADFAFVDIEAIDAEKENFFSQYPAQKIPRADDKTKLYGFYICDMIDAVNEALDMGDRRLAYEELKYLTKERATSLVQRMYVKNISQILEKYGLYFELQGPCSSEDYEIYADKKLFKNLVTGKTKVSPYIFYTAADHDDKYNEFVNYCKDLPGLYFYKGFLSTVNEGALKRFIAPYEKQTKLKVEYSKKNVDNISVPLYIVSDVHEI